MKRLLLSTLISLSSIAAAEPVTPAQTEPTLAQALPALPAYSAVLVHQCGAAVVIIATMDDGAVLTFDMRSNIPWAAQEAWFYKAKAHISVEAKCMIIPGKDVVT